MLDDDPAQTRRRRIFFGFWGALVLAALLLFRAVLLPFVLAVVVAYVFAPLVRALQRVRIGRFRLPRWIAVVNLYVVLLGVLAAFVALGVPRLVVEIEKLTREAPQSVATLRDEWLPYFERTLRRATAPYVEDDAEGPAREDEVVDGVATAAPPQSRTAIRVVPAPDGGYEVHLPTEGMVIEPHGEGYRVHPVGGSNKERADLTTTITEALERASEDTRQTAVTLLRTAQSVVRAVVKGIFTFFIMLMLSAYLLITSDSIVAFFRSLVRYRKRRQFDRLLLRIDKGLSGVVRGQLLICVVNGALSGLGFYLLDLKYWPILMLIATVLSIIPIFGAILSSIPAVIVGLQQGPMTALLVFGWIVVIHQIEANLLNPKIMGDAAKVHPVLVVFALLAGEHLFGIAGALLAVPVLSIAQSLFMHYREVILGVPRHSKTPPAPPVASAGPASTGSGQ